MIARSEAREFVLRQPDIGLCFIVDIAALKAFLYVWYIAKRFDYLGVIDILRDFLHAQTRVTAMV